MTENYEEKQPLPLYIMVSIPEAKEENIWIEPIILGVFETKKLARMAWKNRTLNYNDVRAKTVHVYYEKMQTTLTKAPNIIYASMIYYVKQYGEDKLLEFIFIPSWDGFSEYRIKNPYENESLTFVRRWSGFIIVDADVITLLQNWNLIN